MSQQIGQKRVRAVNNKVAGAHNANTADQVSEQGSSFINEDRKLKSQKLED